MKEHSTDMMLSEGGMQASRIILGVMKWGVWGKGLAPKEMLEIISQSVDLGLHTFDHADIYGEYTTEAAFGQALALQPGLKRKVKLITKCGIRLVSSNRRENKLKAYNTSKEYIIDSVNRSLKNLQVERVHMLLIHRPSPLMHPQEIAEAFEKLQLAGKVLHFGVSNFTPSQFTLLHEYFPLETNQVQASILHLDPFLDGTFDQCIQQRIHPMVWGPMAGGRIFRPPFDERTQRIRDTIFFLQKKYPEWKEEQILLAWLLKHPAGILPVIGTSRLDRIQEARQALELQLEDEDWFYLWQASTGQEVP